MKSFFKDLLYAARATAVLVATLIGAGYATGREVSQYFGEASFATILLSGVLMGLLCVVFMLVGARSGEPKGKVMRLYQMVLALFAVVSCGVMVSAAKTLLDGAFTAILVALGGVLLSLSGKVFHVSNLVAVPILIGLVLLVFCGAPKVGVGTRFLPLTAANYAGMNLLFEGELLRREGKDMSLRAILLAGVGIAACMSLLLYLMHTMVGASPAALPFAEICALQGKRGVVTGVILTSILTNIAGCMCLVLDTCRRYAPVSISAMASLVAMLGVGMIPFSSLVRYVYPVMGWLGMAVGIAYVVWYAIMRFGTPKNRTFARKRIKNCVNRRNKSKSFGKLPIDTLRNIDYNITTKFS